MNCLHISFSYTNPWRTKLTVKILIALVAWDKAAINVTLCARLTHSWSWPESQRARVLKRVNFGPARALVSKFRRCCVKTFCSTARTKHFNSTVYKRYLQWVFIMGANEADHYGSSRSCLSALCSIAKALRKIMDQFQIDLYVDLPYNILLKYSNVLQLL